MTRHVDVVKNDPLAGTQQRLATLIIDGDELHIRADDADAWRERLERLAGTMNGHGAAEYVAVVAERLADSTYISVTEPHSDADCAFADGDVIDAPVGAAHLTSA